MTDQIAGLENTRPNHFARSWCAQVSAHHSIASRLALYKCVYYYYRRLVYFCYEYKPTLMKNVSVERVCARTRLRPYIHHNTEAYRLAERDDALAIIDISKTLHNVLPSLMTS